MTLTPTKIRQQMAKKKATKKSKNGINWINSWSASNKKNVIEVNLLYYNLRQIRRFDSLYLT